MTAVFHLFYHSKSIVDPSVWVTRTIDDALPVSVGSRVVPYEGARALRIERSHYLLDRRQMDVVLETFAADDLHDLQAFLDSGWTLARPQ